MNQPDW